MRRAILRRSSGAILAQLFDRVFRYRYAQGLGYGTKLAFFLGAICVEKVTLVGEILPVGIVLPALSPVLFGGVAQARAQFSSARSILPARDSTQCFKPGTRRAIL